MVGGCQVKDGQDCQVPGTSRSGRVRLDPWVPHAGGGHLSTGPWRRSRSTQDASAHSGTYTPVWTRQMGLSLYTQRTCSSHTRVDQADGIIIVHTKDLFITHPCGPGSSGLLLSTQRTRSSHIHVDKAIRDCYYPHRGLVHHTSMWTRQFGTVTIHTEDSFITHPCGQGNSGLLLSTQRTRSSHIHVDKAIRDCYYPHRGLVHHTSMWTRQFGTVVVHTKDSFITQTRSH